MSAGSGVIVAHSDTIDRTERKLLLDARSHWDVTTTMIYTLIMSRGGRGVRSPLDQIYRCLTPPRRA